MIFMVDVPTRAKSAQECISSSAVFSMIGRVRERSAGGSA